MMQDNEPLEEEEQQQQPLFTGMGEEEAKKGLHVGRILREIGLAVVEGARLQRLARQEFLEDARFVGAEIARDKGVVNADDIRKEVPIPEGVTHNIMGAVFKNGAFRPTGFRQSSRPEAHATWLRDWELIGEEPDAGICPACQYAVDICTHYAYMGGVRLRLKAIIRDIRGGSSNGLPSPAERLQELVEEIS